MIPAETTFAWLTQKVPIWGVLIGLALGSGMGALGTAWRNSDADGFDARSNAIITEHIMQLKGDQAALAEELRQAISQLRIAMDKKVDTETKKDIVDNLTRRLDVIEHHIEIQDTRFDSLLDNMRVGRPH